MSVAVENVDTDCSVWFLGHLKSCRWPVYGNLLIVGHWLLYISRLIIFNKLFQLPSFNNIIYCEYEFYCLCKFSAKGTKTIKIMEFDFKKKEKFVCICYSLNNISTTMRKNDWMVITFEETPTNIWELVLLFFCWLVFLPIHIPVFWNLFPLLPGNFIV